MSASHDSRPTSLRRLGPGGAIRKGIAAGARIGLIALVRGYQVGLRPLLIGSCKYCPTCSEYFIEAVQKHGAMRGAWLGTRRLLRCHPFGPGGIDPVP
jgi:uncharacterized protein